jgi:hypothetical protein
VFYSGDIDVIILNEAFKNKAYKLLLTEEPKIYKKDYFIKISGVLFSVYVVYEKGVNNTYLITTICEVLRIISPSL